MEASIFKESKPIFSREQWSKLLPEKVLEFSQKISSISIGVLKAVYSWAQFPECDYEKISGGAILGRGTSALTFNNYPVNKQKKGLGEHQDFGQVTLLFIDKVGLEVQFQDNWVDVKPMENHFVVLFGQTLEVLINDKSRLIAASHRVVQCFEDRMSIALFTHNHNDTQILQRTENGLIVYRTASHEFLMECLQKTLAFK